VRHRLVPIRPPYQRFRVRVSLAALLLPFCAILLLARMEPTRRPLDEREAALAIDLQRLRRGPDAVETATHGPWTTTTLSLVAGAPRLVGNRELQLRLPGILAGCAAIAVLTLLGRRLFAPRVGVAAGIVLLAAPAGRQLLGVGLGGEPFFVLAMATALLAMREMARTRVAALIAGIACGVACAIAGLDALWLPLLALAWLRANQGLTWRSGGVIVGATAGVAALLTGIGWLAFGRNAGVPLLPDGYASFSYLDPTLIRPRLAAMQLLPLLPLVLVGVFSMQSTWWRSESFRFVLLWLVLATGSWAITGTAAGALVAVVMAASAVALLALEHTRRLIAIPACAIALGIAFGMWRATPPASESQFLERWAIRETGRFVGRVIDEHRTIAADPRVARRLAYYGNRRIDALADGAPPIADVDYVIVPRDEFQARREHRAAVHDTDSARGSDARLKRVAEFGGWVVARVGENPAERTAQSTPDSPSVRPR
jgi:hypothetical protein